MNFTFHLTGNARRRNPATTLHLMVAVMLFGIAIASGFLFWFTSVSPNFKSPYFQFLLFGFVCLVVSFALIALTVRQRKEQKQHKLSAWVYIELLVLLGGSVLFMVQGQYMPALLFLLMALAVGFASFQVGKRKEEGTILFNEKNIQVPGKIRAYPWREVNKVLYKKGTLTIELSGNRIWQQFVTTDADPEIFEAWVLKMMDQYAAERAKEW